MVSVKDTYGGTNKLFLEFLPRFQIEVELCNTTDHASIEAAIAKGCRVLYLESPTNPTLKVLDLARLARAAHAVGAVVVADNTFATPINQNPLTLGVDLVLHSATKFLGGHADDPLRHRGVGQPSRPDRRRQRLAFSQPRDVQQRGRTSGRHDGCRLQRWV